MRCDSSVRLSSCTSGTYIVCKLFSIAVLLNKNALVFFVLLNFSLKDSGEKKLYYCIYIIELYYAMMLRIAFFPYCHNIILIKEAYSRNSVALAGGYILKQTAI